MIAAGTMSAEGKMGKRSDFSMLRVSLVKLAFLYHMCRDGGDFFVQNG